MRAISSEKVCFLIVKTREFDAKNVPIIQDISGAPTDDDGLMAVSAHGDGLLDDTDTVYEELMSFLTSLSDEELVELHGMVMLGRGDVDMDGWEDALQMANDDLDESLLHRLLEIPMISDYLADSLSQFGYRADQ